MRYIVAYFNNFRPHGAIKRVFGSRFLIQSLMPVYYIIIMFTDDSLENAAGSEWLLVCSLILKMYYFVFSGTTHAVRYDKMFYLCPMDRSERRRHYIEAYYGKIIVNMTVSIIMDLLLVIFCENVNAWNFMTIIVMDFALATVMSKPEDAFYRNSQYYAAGFDMGVLITWAASTENMPVWLLCMGQLGGSGKVWPGILISAISVLIFVPMGISNFKARRKELIEHEVYGETVILK